MNEQWAFGVVAMIVLILVAEAIRFLLPKNDKDDLE